MELTVVVPTLGRASFPYVMEALKRQSVQVNCLVIENVTPINAMMEEVRRVCPTRYFLKVDDDVLLHPQAVEFILLNAREQDGKTAFVVYMIWDSVRRRRRCQSLRRGHRFRDRIPGCLQVGLGLR